MARAKVILQSDYPYSITARCINKEWFNIPMDTVWEIFCEQLTATHKAYDMQIHSFVLMSNHFHLLVTTPQANVSDCMQNFMSKTSRALTKAGNRINETFAGRHYKCILQEQNYFMNAYKYNYRNPVVAKLCDRVEDYPYSTLAIKLKLINQKLPLIEDQLIKHDLLGTLRWLNQAPDKKTWEAARAAFKKQYFQSRKHRLSTRLVLGPKDLL